MDYDIFNGDAGGICSLIQLRMAEPRESVLVTGVKQDLNLLERVEVASGDQLTVLDLPMDKNRRGVKNALAKGAQVFFVDHHSPGEIPVDKNLTTLIDEAANVSTAVLVNMHLQDRYIEWAITGAFGDGLRETGHRLARKTGLSTGDQLSLEELGIYINYNSFGHSVADLHFDPKTLYQALYEAGDPLNFIRHSSEFRKLSDSYREDMARPSKLHPIQLSEKTATYVFPDESWARRIRGLFTNHLVTTEQGRAHAIVTRKSNGNYSVSVRAPLGSMQGAIELCARFPTAGGNAAAANIGELPAESLEVFVDAFVQAYAD